MVQDPAEDKAKKFERTPIQAPTIQEPEKPKAPEAEEKYAWGTNMLLVGDTFWCSFKRLAGLAYYLLVSFFPYPLFGKILLIYQKGKLMTPH